MPGAARPWPVPAAPWIMRQSWHDLLFAHWPVPADALAPRLPRGLALDTFDGQAWLGIVPFRLSGLRPRWMPPSPGVSAFLEVNVRTYVTAGGKPGVWFLSLDASSRLAVRGARLLFRLPYHHARMRAEWQAGGMRYESHRPGAALRAEYRPCGERFTAAPGTLAHFLTERYCLYAADPRGLLRCEVDHPPWPLQPAELRLDVNTLSRPCTGSRCRRRSRCCTSRSGRTSASGRSGASDPRRAEPPARAGAVLWWPREGPPWSGR